MKNDAEKLKAAEKEAAECYAYFLGVWEKRHASFGSGKYYLGDTLTAADFFIFNLLHTLLSGHKSVVLHVEISKAAPTLVKKHESYRTTEGPLKVWYDSDLFVKGSF